MHTVPFTRQNNEGECERQGDEEGDRQREKTKETKCVHPCVCVCVSVVRSLNWPFWPRPLYFFSSLHPSHSHLHIIFSSSPLFLLSSMRSVIEAVPTRAFSVTLDCISVSGAQAAVMARPLIMLALALLQLQSWLGPCFGSQRPREGLGVTRFSVLDVSLLLPIGWEKIVSMAFGSSEAGKVSTSLPRLAV